MNISPEFSRLIAVMDIPPSGLTMEIEASPEERARLAQRFDLLALDRLRASLRLTQAKDLFLLEARFEASLSQACVVTLEPVPAEINVEFSRLYGDDEALAKIRAVILPEIDIDAEAEDEPDPIEHGRIDAGEAVAEELALSLEPFPRKPGASLENSPWAAKEPGPENSPFAKLSKLQDKLGKKV
ncbi:MAG: DUF177 domain-containing protein [Rhodospirillales bacterium]|jgi:uncharacterized metal-binding protein YceD (DUF177 family)|nr:DUF177 domain-containing protein [Rhodospirillales bacterium]